MYLISMWVFSLGIIISSVSVITSIKPVNGIISLILVFINGIGIFMITGQDFIGLIYCIVYVGAIAILFLFIILLLYNSPSGELLKENNRFINNAKPLEKDILNNKYIIVLIGILFISVVYCGFIDVLSGDPYTNGTNVLSLETNNNNLLNVSSKLLNGNNNVLNTVNDSYCSDIYTDHSLKAIANMFYSVISFELLFVIGLILLVGMIGAIVLTLK